MSANLYSDEMYRFDEPSPSYWEATSGDLLPHSSPLTEDAKCEVAIIGGGYTGLSAAYHLCRDHHIDTRVLEAGHFGWGASGRNGGFCSMGGTSLGTSGLIRKYGVEATRHFYSAQIDAVELVRGIIEEEGIDSPIQGDCEIEVACSPSSFDNMSKESASYRQLLGLDTGVVSRQQLKDEYFDVPFQYGATISRPTFGLHPYRYVQGLADAAARNGAILHDHSEIIEWRKEAERHILRTRSGSVSARYVIISTNGFTPEHLHASLQGKTLPLISSIMVTRPLREEELALHSWNTESPTFTSLDLLDYFRLLPDQRFLLGGRGSSDGSSAKTQSNMRRLKNRFDNLFPAWRDIAVDYQWHGLVCLTRRLTPAVGRLDEDRSTFFAFGYHGNGVNNANWCGREVARWLAGSSYNDTDVPDSLPVVMRGMSDGFPLPSLRLCYVQARIAAMRVGDWWRSRHWRTKPAKSQ